MPQSRTLYVGMDGHKDSIAVAYVSQEPQAEVLYFGALSTRQGDIDQLIRNMPSNSTPRVFVYAAGPCGYWLYRSLTQKVHGCWGVVPALSPNKAGERVKTTRRDAIQLARLMRSGDLPPVSGPQVADEALRALSRARAEAWRALKTAKHRLTALLLRHDIRYTGQATWSPAPLRWRSEVAWPTLAQPMVFPE